MVKPDKTKSSLIRHKVDNYSDEELRKFCKQNKLNPGPLNDKTRKAWQRRLADKLIEATQANHEPTQPIATVPIITTHAMDFSADEEALTQAVVNQIEDPEALENLGARQQPNASREKSDDEDFSDKDTELEENSDSEENQKSLSDADSDKKSSDPEVQTAVDGKTACSDSKIEPEPTRSAVKNTKKTETPENEKSPAPQNSAKPCQIRCCLTSLVTFLVNFVLTVENYLVENFHDISQMVIILLVAYILLKFKSQMYDLAEIFESLGLSWGF